MADLQSVLSYDNAVFAQFVFYAMVVILKMMIMSPLTAKNRVFNDVYSNPEDLKLSKKPEIKINMHDPHVERLRRCHRNDLENIIPFVFVGLFYCLTGPNHFYASLHFRLFAGARVFHTIAYMAPIPQPSRFLACVCGWVVTASMAVVVLQSASF